MKAESIISIRNLGHNFGENKVLDGINLEVKRGEIIGLLGPSGAGKTTMVNILTGQIKPATGEAMVLGESSLSLSSEAHSKIGIMMESFGFYERLSVADNLKIYAGIFGRRIFLRRLGFGCSFPSEADESGHGDDAGKRSG